MCVEGGLGGRACGVRGRQYQGSTTTIYLVNEVTPYELFITDVMQPSLKLLL